ncbi:MAG: efflux RND transporter periplasmic adaptor subunit [Pseudomonadales bacterium]|jgi:Cu(I)/Ag(I) efflux system membrane fusion protein|nr:efflux RND transporter periplasmic adaptor subunit [Pseudomonadales bacterium]
MIKARMLLVALLALVGGLSIGLLWPRGGPPGAAPERPLYWVAPMDPSYRRDGPGKSPMGMELVPVYATDAEPAPGVRIDPTLTHNFGVRLGRVERAPIDEGLTTLGTVVLAEPLISHVHTRVSGWVEQLVANAQGDPVRRGDVLLELYSPELVRAQDEFLIARVNGNGALLSASLSRLRALGLSQEQIDALARRGEADERIALRAEDEGFVVALNVREGMFIEPGTEIMVLGSVDVVWVLAEIFEHQVPGVAVGQGARMTVDYLPGRVWEGEIEYLYPQLQLPTRTLRVRLSFPNPDGVLRPGMFGKVRIEASPTAPTLVVPVEALIRSGGDRPDRVVVALSGDRYRSRAVRVGRVTSTQAEILAGVAEGERVVLSGQFLIDSESDIDTDLLRMDAPDSDGRAGSMPMDHSGMDHSGMDHSGMDHSGMDHSGTAPGSEDDDAARAPRSGMPR